MVNKHFITPSSLDLYPNFHEYAKHNDMILDVGCGFGRTLSHLTSLNYQNLFGIDNDSYGSLQSEVLAFGHPDNVNILVANALKIPFANQTFDVLINQAFWNYIIGWDNRMSIIKEMYRVLKPKRHVYAAIFAQSWDVPIYTARYQQGYSIGLEVGTYDVTHDGITTRHHHYTYEELLRLFENDFFHIVSFASERFTSRSGYKPKGFIIIAERK